MMNNTRKTEISDELLSAYIDGELDAETLADVEQALADDAAVAARLARLACADQLVRRHAALIDEQPMPQAVLDLLKPATQTNNVIALSAWQRGRRAIGHAVREHAALAASLALAVGFAFGYMTQPQLQPGSPDMAWASALDTALSGQPVALNNDRQLTANFSFLDADQRLCRQFDIVDAQQRSQQVACRDESQWQVLAVVNQLPGSGSEYQTASGSSVLDPLLDSLMSSAILTREQEQAALQR